MLLMNLLKRFLKSLNTVKCNEKHFNKDLIMSEEEEFHLSNTCWMCDKLIDDDNEKVRNYCHITLKFRGTAHWSCNINL